MKPTTVSLVPVSSPMAHVCSLALLSRDCQYTVIVLLLILLTLCLLGECSTLVICYVIETEYLFQDIFSHYALTEDSRGEALAST